MISSLISLKLFSVFSAYQKNTCLHQKVKCKYDNQSLITKQYNSNGSLKTIIVWIIMFVHLILNDPVKYISKTKWKKIKALCCQANNSLIFF